MTIGNFNIDAYSLTGRSGINLDEYGHTISDGSLACWVIDGVSPIMLRKEHVWQYRKFHKATKLLNDWLKKAEWKGVLGELSKFARTIVNSDKRDIFLKDLFFLRPLFSCAIVFISPSNKVVDISIYGDCVVIIKKGSTTEIYKYKSLEKLKDMLDNVFGVSDWLLPKVFSICFKKAIFIIIRWIQMYIGKYRVLYVNNIMRPGVLKTIDIQDIERLYICSDGVSWFFNNDDYRLGDFLRYVDKNGARNTLEKLREHERENTGFGRYDDSTLVVVDFEK